MPNLVNRMVMRQLSTELSEVEGMVIVSYGGLTVAENESLRDNLAAKGVRLRMVSNRLARKALSERGLQFGADVFRGNTAIAFGSTEATIGAAKVLTDKDVKKAGKVHLRGGVFEGAVLDARSAEALAALPDKKTVQAQLLGVLSGPARGLACVLNGLPGGLARVVKAHADKLENPS